jgi:hypothetical protein
MRERRKKAAQNVSGIRRMVLKQANAAKKGDPFKSFTEFDNSSRTYLVCLLDATKISTGFVGDFSLIAAKQGLFIVAIRGQ